LHPTQATVSVIIPTYNRGWTICEAVDSVLTQDHRPMEIILVDDGSTDDTPDRLAGYGSRIHVIRQPNRGVSAARNRGIAEASGELIAFLDSDDAWLPGKLSRQVAFFQEHADALICQTQELWIRKGVRVNPRQRHRKPSGMIFLESLHLCLVSPSAVMARKRLFEQVGLFDESLPACEDYDLWLRVSQSIPIHIIDETLIVKRGGHEDQLSRNPGLDRYRIQAIVRRLESGTLSPQQTQAAIAVLAEKCRIYAAGCRKRGRIGEAARFESLAVRWFEHQTVRA